MQPVAGHNGVWPRLLAYLLACVLGLAAIADQCWGQPAIRGVGAVASSTGPVAPGLPVDNTVGDLLLMFVETDNQAVTVSGWTELPTCSPSSTTGTRLTVFYKIAVGSDATTTSDSGDHQAARIIGVKQGSFDPVSPFDGCTSNQQTATTSVSISGGTSGADNSLVFAATAGDLPDSTSTAQFASWTNANLVSITEQIDNARNAGNGGAIGVAIGAKAVAGAWGATTVTGATTAARANISFAVKLLVPTPTPSTTPTPTTTSSPTSTPVIVVSSMITVNGDPRAPSVYTPGVTVVESALKADHDGVAINGVAYASRDKGTVIWVNNGATTTQIYGDDAQAIAVWENTIYLDWSATALSKAAGGWVQVRTPRGITGQINLTEFYTYSEVELTAPSGEESTLPIWSTVIADGTIYASAEFAQTFFWKVTPGGVASTISITKAPDPGPYASELFGLDLRTHISAVEKIIVDPSGNIWTVWGGAYLYNGGLPNHSRIIKYNPSTSAVTCYNMPGNNNGAVSLAWNATDSRMYVLAQNLGDDIGTTQSGASAVWSFDPTGITADCSWDFTGTLPEGICAGAPGSDCWAVYNLPPAATILSHLIVHNGLIYVTVTADGYSVPNTSPARNRVAIAVVDPAIGVVRLVHMGVARTGYVFAQAPFGLNFLASGKLAWANTADVSVMIMDDPATVHPVCLSTNANYDNGCINNVLIPRANPIMTWTGPSYRDEAHSIAEDSVGRVWFTLYQNARKYEQLLTHAGVGYVTDTHSHAVMLAPICIYHDCAVDLMFATGTSIDPTTDDTIFAIYRSEGVDSPEQLLGRIHEQ